MTRRTLVLSLALSLLVIFACKKKNTDDPSSTGSDSFDKKAMLVNLADQVILPDYLLYQIALDDLRANFEAFKIQKDSLRLQNLIQSFDKAYLMYQSVSPYGFGPAEDIAMRSNCNIFPCNVSTIQSNLVSGVYNLAATSNLSAKGFSALEYLFYGKGQTFQELLNVFSTDNNRVMYVQSLLNDLHTKASQVVTSWQGGYRETFIGSLGTDLGSSIGFLVNQLNFELDYLKNAKIATPLGLKSGGVPLPDNAEAYYSGKSLNYALETLTAIEDLYLGRNASGNNGLSFDDYLDHLKVTHVSVSLNQAIQIQFNSARKALNAIPDPLSEQVNSNSTLVKTAHDELVKLLVLLKTDMPSALGVVITYQDGDGD